MRILVADDNDGDRLLLRSMLERWGYEVISVEDGLQAVAVLTSDEAPRLAILDWMMPGLAGPDVCRTLRAQRSVPYVYILLLTARTERCDLIAGIQAGADDYLAKPADRYELKARLEAGRRVVDLQDRLLAVMAELEHRATHDALTGLMNRQALLVKLNAISAAGDSFGLIMLDIDNFKEVNDTHGHAAGDVVLTEIAGLLLHAIGPDDKVGRYGGEEFIVISKASESEVAGLAERIRLRVAEIRIHHYGRALSVTVSLGVAHHGGGCSGDTEMLLLQSADTALYEAKKSGRNCVFTANSH